MLFEVEFSWSKAACTWSLETALDLPNVLFLSTDFQGPPVAVCSYLSPSQACLRVRPTLLLSFFFFFKDNFIYLLAVLGLRCCTGFPLVVASRLLIVVAFLVAEHRLLATWASVVVACGFRSFGSGL